MGFYLNNGSNSKFTTNLYNVNDTPLEPSTPLEVGDSFKAEVVFYDNDAYRTVFNNFKFNLISAPSTVLSLTPTDTGTESLGGGIYKCWATYTIPNEWSTYDNEQVNVIPAFDTTQMIQISVSPAYDSTVEGSDIVSASVSGGIDENYYLPGGSLKMDFIITTKNNLGLTLDYVDSTVTTVNTQTQNRYPSGDNLVNYLYYDVTISPDATGSQTATFHFTKAEITHTVTFLAGQEVVANITVTDGEAISKEDIPIPTEAQTPSHQIFDYWALNGIEFDFSTLITSDLVLDAVFADSAEVVFVADGSVISTLKVKEGTVISQGSVPSAPEKEGYNFDYWAYHGMEFDFTEPIMRDMILEAEYSLIYYDVYYVESFESYMNIRAIKVAYGNKADNIKPIKESIKSETDGLVYNFIYWYTDDANTPYDFNTPITEGVTLIARYVIAGNHEWVMDRHNCLVGLASNIEHLPLANVETGTRAMALSESGVKYYTFYKPNYTWYPDVAEE